MRQVTAEREAAARGEPPPARRPALADVPDAGTTRTPTHASSPPSPAAANPPTRQPANIGVDSVVRLRAHTHHTSWHTL
jgi:hypothetical protein